MKTVRSRRSYVQDELLHAEVLVASGLMRICESSNRHLNVLGVVDSKIFVAHELEQVDVLLRAVEFLEGISLHVDQRSHPGRTGERS